MKRTFEISHAKPGQRVWLNAVNVQYAIRKHFSGDDGNVCVRETTDGPVLKLTPCPAPAEMETVAKAVVAESLEKMLDRCAEPACQHRADIFAGEAARLRATLEPAADPHCPGPCPYHNPLAWAEAQKGQ